MAYYSKKTNGNWGVAYDNANDVITRVNNSGLPVVSNGATSSGNIYKVFVKCGFKDVTQSVNLYTGEGLKQDDILLRPNILVEIYDDKKPYNNKCWCYVLRYPQPLKLIGKTSSKTGKKDC